MKTTLFAFAFEFVHLLVFVFVFVFVLVFVSNRRKPVWCYSNPMIAEGKKRVTGARVMAAPSQAQGVATPTTRCAFVLYFIGI